MNPRSAIARRVATVTDATRTQLWPLPLVGIVVAVAAGVLLPKLDQRIDDDLSDEVKAFLFGGGSDAARAVLGAIAGSLVTLTSLTFSLTVVTLQLASGQFSPRLLRTFTRDRFVHFTLTLFLTTFVYALTVLRTVRTDAPGQDEFVPQISVTVAFLLAMASVLGLVFFLAHLVKEIRVETMLRRVHSEADETVRRVLPERDADTPLVTLPNVPPQAVPLVAEASGFMTGLDEEAVLAAAVETDAVVMMQATPGDSLVVDTPIAFAWSATGGRPAPDTTQQLQQRVACAVGARFEHTAAQDITFGLRQLTDVANKALSPGINDPTTANHAIGHTSALLCAMVRRDLGPWVLRDDRERVRVVLCRPDLDRLLELAVAGPRRYGAADPDVLARLYVLLREVAWCTNLPSHREAIFGHLERMGTTAAAQDFDQTETARLMRLHRQVSAALRGEWGPDQPEGLAPAETPSQGSDRSDGTSQPVRQDGS